MAVAVKSLAAALATWDCCCETLDPFCRMWQVYQLFSFSHSASVSALWLDVAASVCSRYENRIVSHESEISLSLSLSSCVSSCECVRRVAGLPPVIKNYSQQIQKRLLFIAMIQRCPPQSVWLWLSTASSPRVPCLLPCLCSAIKLNYSGTCLAWN